MEFDPDAYLAQGDSTPAQSSGFDPDAYLASNEAPAGSLDQEVANSRAKAMQEGTVSEDGTRVIRPDGTTIPLGVEPAQGFMASQQIEPQSQRKLVLPNYTRGLGRSILQGALLGFGDEAAAGVATGLAKVTGNIPEGQTMADTYKDIKGSEQEDQAAFVEENPKTAFGAELARGLGRSILQGALLGFGDEAVAGIGATTAQVAGTDKTWADVYKDIKGSEQEDQAAFVEENPKTAFGAELAGGLVTGGLAGGAKMAGAKTLGQVAKTGAKTGAALGATYGAGTAETGDTLEESAINMAVGGAKGGLIGAATGGIVTPTLVGGARVIGAAGRNIADRFFKGDAEKAATYVQQLAEQSGFTPEQLAARYEKLGPQATLADVSENLLAGAKSATDQIGPTKEAARTLVGNRQQGQFGETIGILSKQLGGITGDDAVAALAKNAQERTAKAAPLYEQALKSNVENSEALQKLQALPVFKKAYAQAGEYAANDLSRVAKDADPNMLGGSFKAGQLTEAEKLHYAKQALFDMESAQARAGNSNAAKQIAGARKSLTNDVLDTLQGYKEARNVWSGSMGQEEALTTGRQLFKMTGREFDDAIKGMNEHEKQMARMGLMDAVEEKLGSVADNQNTSGKLVKDPIIRKKLASLLDADQMQALEDNASKWEKFTRTKNKLSGGSPTAENLTVEQESARMIGDINPLKRAGNMMLESIVNPNRLTKENAAEVGNLLLKQGMGQEEVLKLLAKAEKNPNALRQLMQAGKNAMLVDQVPAGYAVSEAVLPTYGKVGRNKDGSPKFGRIQ